MYSLPFARLYRRWRPLAAPSLFFLGVIYYEELFLKLFCFGSLTLPGVFFTLLFSLPVALPCCAAGYLPGTGGTCWLFVHWSSRCGWAPRRSITACSKPSSPSSP